MGARNQVGIGLSKSAHQATYAGGIDSLESILGLLKSVEIRAQASGQILEDDVNGFFLHLVIYFIVTSHVFYVPLVSQHVVFMVVLNLNIHIVSSII
jgi:hypothetical protein